MDPIIGGGWEGHFATTPTKLCEGGDGVGFHTCPGAGEDSEELGAPELAKGNELALLGSRPLSGWLVTVIDDSSFDSFCDSSIRSQLLRLV